MTSQGNQRPVGTIVNRGQAAMSRLADWNLSPELLLPGPRAAELSRRACGPNIAPTAPGFKAWADGNSALADSLATLGFAVVMMSNVPILVHAVTGLALTMVAGDGNTGTDRSPQTRNSRGPAASRMIDDGLDLFSGTSFGPLLTSSTDHNLWYLLWHPFGDVIRLEFSLPVSVEGGRVVSWQERNIIDSFPLVPESADADFPIGEDLDVPVARRPV